ncbi:MAG TPA: DNA polymerase III subunit epsilon [Geminicoccaceae bacterium]|jgi:DNA polymerase-3 subunit epsilon|nr:DNA polymerase III subunit epsilon [Geminicoccaceae bacterium]
MREIVMDTETTGLDPATGHRIVEIGAIELEHHVPTGRHFHCYINPERDMPEDAFRVHGLSSEFLAEHPVFAAIARDFLAFIGEAPLVIHNASFDLRFLNAELGRLDLPLLPASRAIDTLPMAQRKFPGSPANLDALCRRFGVDLQARELHGALLDSRLLAEVYVHLKGGLQANLGLTLQARGGRAGGMAAERRPHRVFVVPPEELAAHEAFVAAMKDPVWRR